MRKGFLIVLAVVLVAVVAAPAMAGMDVSGFVRSKAYMSNFKNGASQPVLKEDASTASYVEQRLRAKFSFGEENVKAVWFVETDFGAFGDTAGGSPTALGGTSTTTNTLGAQRNSGGALGGDRINLETKNIYIWFKVPNTSVDFTVGLQNRTDRFAGLLYGGSDQAGIFANMKLEPASFTLGWAKLYENNFQKWDDVTLYLAEAQFAPGKDLKIGATFSYLADDSQKVSGVATQLPFPTVAGQENKKGIYTAGLDATFGLGPASLTGFALYQFGKIDYLGTTAASPQDKDINGWAADLRADLNLGPGKFFLEGLYVSGDSKDDNTADYKSIFTLNDVNASPGGNSFYGRTDMVILLANADDINTPIPHRGRRRPWGQLQHFGGVRASSPGNCGRGIWHVGTGFSMALGKQLTGKVGAGYLSATKMLKNLDANQEGRGYGHRGQCEA